MARSATKAAKHAPSLLSEKDLPSYDKEALANQRALLQSIEDCKAAREAAAAAAKAAQAEKSALDRKSPDYKKKAKELDARIKALHGVSKKRCPSEKRSCVEADNSKRGAMSTAMNATLNKLHGTNVDLAPIAAWEGGVYLKAYVPWWPDVTSNGAALITRADASGKIATRLTGTVVAGTGGKRNNSGPTIAKGVDFGPQSFSDYCKELDKANATGKYLSEQQLKALKEKIKPYFGMRAGEACKFLREHPLEISQAEADLLNHRAAYKAIDGAKDQWNMYAKVNRLPTFDKLSREQQTALVSNVYQTGKLNPGIVAAISQNDRTLLPHSRERTYLYNAMSTSKPPASPPGKG